ncbi:hypothetical protein TNCV_1879911 [Trichonephila clavipes]|nr:hypothetical protein TNCV_1879911 [Trichonephila clavipes]
MSPGFNLIEHVWDVLRPLIVVGGSASTHIYEFALVQEKMQLLQGLIRTGKQYETPINIIACVIEHDVNGGCHNFPEESRGFRTRQHGRQ